MSITLAVGGLAVQLPADMYWADEVAWHPVEQRVDRSLSGALIVQTKARTAGRPITLHPPVQAASWMRRDVVEQLHAWADTPGQLMTLTLRGQARSVIWRHQDGEAITAAPVQYFDDVQPGDAYTATLKFMEI